MKKITYFFFVLLLITAGSLCINGCMQRPEFSGATVNVAVNETGAPIQKYIYGQFIEHLGRSIYGGIWAEMLMDRKFYYPITDEYSPWAMATESFWAGGSTLEYPYLARSPWQVVGSAGNLVMNSDDPYVGEHTPVIKVNGQKAGIQQNELSVLEGKNYVGRVILAGETSLLPISIQLSTPDGQTETITIENISSEFQTYPIEFTPGFTSDSTSLGIFSEGVGSLRIGTVSLMPADNIKGWRRDVVGLLKELNSPVYRWPGGNFVSGYNWRDGIGERDKRPPRKNPAWKGVEHNDVGIHEYMELMELINSEAFIAVNTGLGTVEEVAEEIQYCNGSVDSDMGRLRASNGHPEPYGVKWWAVGNEMYGDWQLGHMPLSEYVKKHNSMAEAIWDVDSTAKLIAVGHVGEWSETMLANSSNHMDLLSEHIYATGSENSTEHMGLVANLIKEVADAHRKYRDSIPNLKQKDIQIAMDEWNYWYGDYIYGELGVRYYHKDALGIAKGLHEYFRNSDLYFMANYAQTVNVIGSIKTTPNAAGFATTGLPLKLYRNQFGSIPVKVENNSTDLDIVAAITSNKDFITLAIVNEKETSVEIAFDFGDKKIGNNGKQWLIQNDDLMAYNDPGTPPRVKIEETDVLLKNHQLEIQPYSIHLVRLDID
ncbi:MAG: alpha-N-arabinofuranosidase [Flavobacteriaceae bacterium]|nr:alpha-N-arabinofuranosidase [Flavobacteriaceae bacterium]